MRFKHHDLCFVTRSKLIGFDTQLLIKEAKYEKVLVKL